MNKIILLILPILIILSSCELMLPNNKTDRNVYLVSLALNYVDSGVNPLGCTLNDQEAIFKEFSYITNKTSSPFKYFLVTQKGKYLIINDDGNITKQEIDFSKPSKIIKNEILTKLSLYSEKLDENDILFFHYSGHGDTDGGLVYHVENRTYQDYKITPTDLFNSIKINRGTTLLFLDSCYSGYFYDYISSDLNSSNFFKLFNPPNKRNNVFTLTGAQSDEKSLENNGFGNLTRSFLETLGYNTTTKETGMKREHIWFSELITSIQKNIKLYINGSIQHPQGNEIKDFLIH